MSASTELMISSSSSSYVSRRSFVFKFLLADFFNVITAGVNWMRFTQEMKQIVFSVGFSISKGNQHRRDC